MGRCCGKDKQEGFSGPSMYVLKGNVWVRGFSLEKDKALRFRTRHRLGFMNGSMVTIGDANLSVKQQGFVGFKWNIYKNGGFMGHLDISNYMHAIIALKRNDGTVDVFKLIRQGFAQEYILSKSDVEIMRFDVSLNPLNLEDQYRVSVFSNIFTQGALEELIFYAGEILFRTMHTFSRPSFG